MGEMAQRVKVLATKPGCLSSVLKPTQGKKRPSSLSMSSDKWHMHMHAYTHTDTLSEQTWKTPAALIIVIRGYH